VLPERDLHRLVSSPAEAGISSEEKFSKMTIASTIIADRVRRLRKQLRQRKVEALLVAEPIDVGYVSGFTGDDSWLLVGSGKGWLLTDFRYAEQAEAECPDFALVVRRAGLVEALAPVLRRKGVKRLGFDPETVTVALLKRLRKGLKGVRLVPACQIISGLRVRKDALEQKAIRNAVRVAEEAWAAFRKSVRLGMTEQALAAELDHRMRLAGAEGPAFPTIVAIDASASKPHARAGGRRLRRGSVLLVDFGAKVGGYVCDLTRVLFAGKIGSRARRVYSLVQEAQAAGIACVEPGAAFSEVDAAVRRVIADAGFGEQFQHGTGHGIGRQVHEAPALGPRVGKGRLEAGMIVTVEPGIYLRGRFGIRIEDDVLVTPKGHEVLTRVEKGLGEMVLEL
jgi:Xaa-Pro aminopeptidase